MARDGTQTYILPFPDVVADTTIESTVYNGFTNDIAMDLNTARPVKFGGTGATSAAGARTNLGTEAASQLVTNYSSFVFEAGSFYSAAGATGAPTANAFSGICYKADANNMVIEGRDSTTGTKYFRRKVAGVWGSFTVDGSDQFVEIAGDTMTGNLHIGNNSGILIDKTASGNNAIIWGTTANALRWGVRLGDATAEGGSDTGSNFVISRYNDAGANSPAFTIDRGTFLTSIPQGLAGPISIVGTSTFDKHIFSFSGTPGGYQATYSLDATGLKIGHNSGSRNIEFQTNSATRLTIAAGGAMTFAGAATFSTTLAVTGIATFTLSPVVPTPAAADNSTNAASTAFVTAAAVRHDMTQSLTTTQKRQAQTNLFQATTTQVFLSSSGTYTTPAGVVRLEIELVGGGGGGAGSGTTPGATGSGVATTFGTGPLLTSGTGGGAGGQAGGTGPAPTGGFLNKLGTNGGNGAAITNSPGGAGGNSPYGGAGAGGQAGGGAGLAATVNSGSGGGGAGVGATVNGGGGGASGGFLRAIINTPLASYSYAIGAGGAGGTAGTGGAAGGAGGSGCLVVTEFYGS